MNASDRMPTVYLPHGGGPWPFVDQSRFGPAGMYDGMAAYLRELPRALPARPRALLVISAHWEAPLPTVTTSPAPPMLYDYSGFPPETYRIRWPAPGDPELARQVRQLLGHRGIDSAEDPERGYDHGTFVPLMLAWPDADLPTVQLSLQRGLDPATHLAIGHALAPLREQGVFIVGSGMSYHNMAGFSGRLAAVAEDARQFDDWLGRTVRRPAIERDAALIAWESAPRARACHPREEHLLPLMVIAGAGGDSIGGTPFRDRIMGATVSAVHFD
jgi:aromatic ring-opening dioxygenase catalytic subunit (LigB family)